MTIVNLIRSINYIQTIRDHDICDHKVHCSKCILRSAIRKAELGKGLKNFVLIPEIKRNKHMFMGSNFCSECVERFENKEEEISHMEKKNHDKKPVNVKKSLDTLLTKIDFIGNLHLSVVCTEYEEDVNTDTSEYFLVRKKKENIAQALADAVSLVYFSRYI